MITNILLFRIYIIFALFFLLPFSFLISVELFHFIKWSFIGLYFNFRHFTKNFELNSNNSTLLFEFYYKRKKWFLSVCLLELSCIIEIIDKTLLFSFLAYLYEQISYLNIAEYYYLKANLHSPYNTDILSSLANLYDIWDKPDKALVVYRQILSLDNTYNIPQKYLFYL